MQPSALNKKEEVKISNRSKALQHELLVETRDPSAHSLSLLKAAELEAEEIEQLSITLKNALWRDIRKKFDKDAQKMLKKLTREEKLRATVRLQCCARRYLARKRASVLRDQQRVIRAVKSFVKEIAGMKCVDQVDALELSKAFLPSVQRAYYEQSATVKSSPKPIVSQHIGSFTESKLQPLSSPAIRQSIPVFSSAASPAPVSLNPMSTPLPKLTTSSAKSLKSNPPKSDKKDSSVVSTPFSSEFKSTTTPSFVVSSVSAKTNTSIQDHNTTPQRVQQSPRSGKSVRMATAESPLSPFLGMTGLKNSTNMSNGYISPVSESQTLNHSLSLSFGRMTDTSLNRTGDSSKSFISTPQKGERALFEAAVSRYQHNDSPLSELVDQALAGSEKNYSEVSNQFIYMMCFYSNMICCSQRSAIQWMLSFKNVCKPSEFFMWLRDRVESDEVDLEFAAVLFSDIWYQRLPGKYHICLYVYVIQS